MTEKVIMTEILMMFGLMYEVLSLSILVNFFTHWFQPLQEVKQIMIEKILRFAVKNNQFWMEKLLIPLSCSKCLGFWMGLIVFQGISLAVITSLLSYLIHKQINKLEKV